MQPGHLFAAGLLALLVVAGDATAGKVDDLLKDAVEERDAGHVGQAAGLFARAVVAAQASGDLADEAAAARGLNSLFERSSGSFGAGAIVATAGGTTRTTDDQRELLALALGGLDATRNGALVSASAVARQILFAATEHGDTEHCTAAAAALTTAAKRKDAGRAVGVTLLYAQGMAARVSGDTELAAKQFDAAYAAATDESWHDLAAHIGTERAGLRYDAKDVDGAAKILGDVASLLGDEIGLRTAQAWKRAVTARMSGAPESLTSIVNVATKEPLPSIPTPVVSDFGIGQAKTTDLGRALKKGSKKKALVTVLRTSDGLAVASQFEPETERVVLPSPDEQRVELGGLTLTVRDEYVAVYDVQVERESSKGIGNIAAEITRGGIGTLLRAEYLLAHDETWTLTKGDGVSISH